MNENDIEKQKPIEERVRNALTNAQANGNFVDATKRHATIIAEDMVTCDAFLEDEDPDTVFWVLFRILPDAV